MGKIIDLISINITITLCDYLETKQSSSFKFIFQKFYMIKTFKQKINKKCLNFEHNFAQRYKLSVFHH